QGCRWECLLQERSQSEAAWPCTGYESFVCRAGSPRPESETPEGPECVTNRLLSVLSAYRCLSARHLDGTSLDKSLPPIPHVQIVCDQVPTRFHEGDGGGTGEGDAEMLADAFEGGRCCK